MSYKLVIAENGHHDSDENQRAAFELNFEKGAGKYGKSKNKKD